MPFNPDDYYCTRAKAGCAFSVLLCPICNHSIEKKLFDELLHLKAANALAEARYAEAFLKAINVLHKEELSLVDVEDTCETCEHYDPEREFCEWNDEDASPDDYCDAHIEKSPVSVAIYTAEEHLPNFCANCGHSVYDEMNKAYEKGKLEIREECDEAITELLKEKREIEEKYFRERKYRKKWEKRFSSFWNIIFWLGLLAAWCAIIVGAYYVGVYCAFDLGLDMSTASTIGMMLSYCAIMTPIVWYFRPTGRRRRRRRFI